MTFKIYKVVLIMIMMTSLVGCSTLWGVNSPTGARKAGEATIKYLENKYGEKFKIESVSHFANAGTSAAYNVDCYPVADPSIKFRCQLMKADYNQITDEYLNEVMGRKTVKAIEEVARKYWPNTRVQFTYMDLFEGTTHSDINMSVEAYLALYPEVMITPSINIQTDWPISREGEMIKYKAFAKDLAGLYNHQCHPGINYVTEEGYAQLDEAFKSENDTYARTYFENIVREKDLDEFTYQLAFNYFDVNDKGEIVDSQAEFDKWFEIWGIN